MPIRPLWHLSLESLLRTGKKAVAGASRKFFCVCSSRLRRKKNAGERELPGVGLGVVQAGLGDYIS